MEHDRDNLQRLPSGENFGSMPPPSGHPWTPTPSSTDYHWPDSALVESNLWLQNYATLSDPSARIGQVSIETILPQEGLGVWQRSHETSPSPQETTTSATTYEGSKKQPEGKVAPRLERKCTKRRRTGPDRFDRYLHGDMPLPPATTTMDVFMRYPNHITDEDIEELWRLGSSARQISELMPEDTHYNSEGVLVQQHHSLIQKKFKIFKERHEICEQVIKNRAAQPEGPTSAQECRKTALLSTAGGTADLPDLKFRCYPFDPTSDKAFEARMSIELQCLEPVVGRTDREDHEVHFLGLFLRREFHRHHDLLKHQLIQVQPSEFRQAELYNEISRALWRKWQVPLILTAVPATAAEALRVLQRVIDQIYLQHPAATDLPTKRPIFNFEHRDLRRWRVFARTLYFLMAITKRLEADPNIRVPPTSSGKSQCIRRLSGNIQGGREGQIMAVSAPEIRPPDRPSPARGLLSTAFSPGHSNAAYRKFPYEASGEATGVSRQFESSPSPATYGMPSASPAARVIHGGLPAPTAPNPPLGTQFSQPPAMPTTAYDLLTEAEDYASFPNESEDSNDFMNQLIDWQEWETDSVVRSEGVDRAS